MSNFGNIHGRAVVSITKVKQHVNPALVGFYRVSLEDRTEQLISPAEASKLQPPSFLDAEALSTADKEAEVEEVVAPVSSEEPVVAPEASVASSVPKVRKPRASKAAK